MPKPLNVAHKRQRICILPVLFAISLSCENVMSLSKSVRFYILSFLSQLLYLLGQSASLNARC